MTSIAKTVAFAVLLSASLLAATTGRIGVEGMTCQMCARGLQASLSRVPGVQRVRVRFKRQEVVIVYDSQKVSLAQLRRDIQAQGFHPVKAGR